MPLARHWLALRARLGRCAPVIALNLLGVIGPLRSRYWLHVIGPQCVCFSMFLGTIRPSSFAGLQTSAIPGTVIRRHSRHSHSMHDLSENIVCCDQSDDMAPITGYQAHRLVRQA